MEPNSLDACWFTPEHEARALELVRTLPADEIRARGLNPVLRGLRFGMQECLFPDGEGRVVPGVLCTFVCTNILGSSLFKPGALQQLTDGKVAVDVAKYFDLVELAPGLVGGRLREQVLAWPEFIRQRKQQAAVEEAGKIGGQMLEIVGEAEELQELSARYLVTVGHLLGLRDPGHMPAEELTDAILAIGMQGKNIPTFHEWLEACERMPRRPRDIQVAESLELSPLAYAHSVKGGCVVRTNRDARGQLIESPR